MTRKDYELLAAAIARGKDDYINARNRGVAESPALAVQYVQDRIGAMCAAGNPRFNQMRFNMACGA